VPSDGGLNGAYQVLGETAECRDQALHDIVALLLKVEGAAKNQQHTRDAVGVVQLDPLFHLFAQTSRRDALETNTTRLARLLEFFGSQAVDTLGMDHLLVSCVLKVMINAAHHVINAELFQSAAHLMFQEIVGTESVDVDVLAHRY
jgi:hypothetical protein